MSETSEVLVIGVVRLLISPLPLKILLRTTPQTNVLLKAV